MWLLRVGSHVGGTSSPRRGQSGSLARNCIHVAVSRRIDCFLRFFVLGQGEECLANSSRILSSCKTPEWLCGLENIPGVGPKLVMFLFFFFGKLSL